MAGRIRAITVPARMLKRALCIADTSTPYRMHAERRRQSRGDAMEMRTFPAIPCGVYERWD
jgi:hypothetical protein